MVIGSVAGGTGAGSFLDMGWLAGALAAQDVAAHQVDMMMFLPSGYASANKERTEANGYASLMELETCMKGGHSFVQRWDLHDNMQLSGAPFDEVYLIDSGNLTGQATSNQSDVYEMVADTLFEDFRSADFANKKRSVAVNQSQHKIIPFSAPVPQGRFGDMKLNYFKGYSAFGQSVLDTQSANLATLEIYRWVRIMLESFFGVDGNERPMNRATVRQRDEFLDGCMNLKAVLFDQIPEFSSKVDLSLVNGALYDVVLTDKLLHDSQGSLLAGVEQRVQSELATMAERLDKDEWPGRVREIIAGLERDCIRSQERSADTGEDRISAVRKQLSAEMQEILQVRLYQYLDHRELGGLEYVLSLVELVKERLLSSHDGIIKQLQHNARCYGEIRDALRASECERLLANLMETRGSSLFSNKKKQAQYILESLKSDISEYLQFHLRATAASQAAVLLQELAVFLGDQSGLNEDGEVCWTGLVGAFQEGRQSVLVMLRGIRDLERRLEEENQASYASFCRIDAATNIAHMPSKEQLTTWAEDALKEIGGSRELFNYLVTDKGQQRIFRCLNKRARDEYEKHDLDAGDPLVQALQRMDVSARQKVFANWLSRAMPWIDANMGREFTPIADQFKCYIGVGRSADYEPFRDDIIASLPPRVGVTPAQVSFVDSGEYGRAVCYVELSGIPLTVLRGLETWKVSYLKESEKIPVHTKADVTAFEHPLVPSVTQLNTIADDFETYIQAIMLGLLQRDTNGDVRPAGQYQFSVGRGDVRRMGNERAFRLNGLPKAYQQKINTAVALKLEELDGWQMAALAALADYFARETYTPRLQPDEKGTEVAVKGFAAAIAEGVKSKLLERASSLGVSTTDAVNFESLTYNGIDKWTDVIEHSDQDAYAWEVRERESPRLKRSVKPDFFSKGWLGFILNHNSARQGMSFGEDSPTNPAFNPPEQTTTVVQELPATPDASMAPPPVIVSAHKANVPFDYDYYIHIKGQNMGPYPGRDIVVYLQMGKLTPETLCWREGWPNWLMIRDVSELRAPNTPPPLPLGAVDI